MKDWITAFCLTFLLSTVLTALLIPLLRRLKFGQYIREDGIESDLKKAGTPTMGGIAWLAALALVMLLYIGKYPVILPILLITLGFGLIGFLDDMLKIRRKHSEGLKVWQKFLLQFLFAGLFCLWQMKTAENPTVILLPFSDKTLDLGWVYVPFLFAVILGTDNGTNFTDGADGLCSSVTIPVALLLTFLSAAFDGGFEPAAAGMAGALMGFLLFNTNPAKVFMGDTGALAIGAFVASSALILRRPLLILIFGIIYLAEVLSVVLQVGYFKLTHGKRIFKMAPIHHHFEKCGWSEPRVVAVFTAVTVLFCFIAYLGA